MRRHKIVYEPLSKLLKMGVRGNPKKHDEETIRASFNRFGIVVPMLVDDGANLIGAGHGRSTVLGKMRDEPRDGEKVPDGVDVRRGEWWVPVIRGVRFKDQRELRRYVLVDNKAQENGGWDDTKLPGFLEPFFKADDLEGTGFGDSEVARIMGNADSTAGASAAPELKEQWAIVVDCKGESHQASLLRKFQRMGLKVRALSS